MDDAFGLVRPGNSTTKTTATVTTEPRTLGLNESAKVRFPTNRPTRKLLKSCRNIELPTEPGGTEGGKNS
jgi:hypothetical protein